MMKIDYRMNDMIKPNQQFTLGEIPLSNRTITIDDIFMISDNLDDSNALDTIEFPKMGSTEVNSPFYIRFSMILGCVTGSMTLRINMKEFSISEGCLMIIVEDSIGECLHISTDAKIFMIAYSKSFELLDYGSLAIPPTEEMSIIMRNPLIQLRHIEMQHIINNYELLRFRLNDSGFQAKKELAGNCIRVIHSFVSSNFQKIINHAKAKTRGEYIFEEFIRLVGVYGLQHRELEFYSDRLFISTKHLSKVISQESGRSPKSWICMRVILEAKVLLGDNRLSILQISEHLNFPNQSFFGTFFKSRTGMSPSEYKRKCIDQTHE